MSFEIVSPEINRLVPRRLVHDVVIHRYLYQHNHARVVLDWDEGLLEGEKASAGGQPTAMLGASMIGAKLSIGWRGVDLETHIECFTGYVESVCATHFATRSQITLECVSLSQKADLVSRHRVWQACTLLDVCQHVAGKEPLFKIMPDAEKILGQITIDLTVQYEETDFAYLGRMLHAWGIPMSVSETHIIIGTKEVASKGVFPAINWRWDSITLEGKSPILDETSRNTGPGATGTAKKYAGELHKSLKRTTSDYHPQLDDDHLEEREWIAERVFDSVYQTNTSLYRLKTEGNVFDYPPGTAVPFADQTFLVRAVTIKNETSADFVVQEFTLQDHLVPLLPYERKTPWHAQMLWGRVTQNDSTDPYQEGRVQIKFDWETLDPTGGDDKRCWLPVVTPYAGKTSTGFLSLPEIGEHVLVQFLGDWDSEAVVIGSVREAQKAKMEYDPAESKRWSTPSGNQIVLTTTEDGTEIVTLKCKDEMFFESQTSTSGKHVIMQLGGSKVHLSGGAGPPQLDLISEGNICISAGGQLYLEGGMVQVKSNTGPLNIDGAPLVMINCSPWSLSPKKYSPKEPKLKSGKLRKRAKPPKWTGTVPVATSATEKPKRDFIEYVLKDKDTGEPISGERWRVKLPDGTSQEGKTDKNGRLRIDNIPPGNCQVSFPDMDAGDWKDL
jgi:phage baseplate assembly protein gpV